MIRIVLSLTKILIGVVVALAFGSCDLNVTKGNGDVVSKIRNVDHFTKVSGEGGVEVAVTMSDKESVTVEADSNLHDLITTEVKDGTLIVKSSGNVMNAKSFKILVTMPAVSALSISGGSTLKSSNLILSDAIHLSSSSGSEMVVNIEADSVFCESSSGSEVDLNGKALHFESTSSSGSEVNAKGLLANTVSAQATSGSSSDVHAIVSISAKASSGSDISYYGNPKKVDVTESSGASIGKK